MAGVKLAHLIARFTLQIFMIRNIHCMYFHCIIITILIEWLNRNNWYIRPSIQYNHFMKELSSLLRTVKDPRVQDTMISITRVETTPDLRYTKVYVSFLQSDRAKQAMVGLKSAGGYLRRELGHALQLRYAPEIVWAEDDSIEYGAKMLQLINSLEVTNNEEADEG